MGASVRNLSRSAVPAATLLSAIVAWEVASRVLRIPKFIMPAPSDIAAEAWEWRYRFLGHSWVTLYETLGGFALSIVVAVPLAVLIVYSPWMRRAIYPLIVLLQAVPKIAVAPVLLLIIGYGGFSKVIVAFLVAFFPIVVDTATGLRNTPADLIDLATSVRANAFQTFCKIRFPAALPFIISGSKVAITLAVIGAVIGEFIGSNEGLGNLMLVANSQINIPLAFAALFGLALIGILLYSAVVATEWALRPWFGEIAH